MDKEEIIKLLKDFNFPKDEYYVLSGASLVIRGLRDKASDIDLCISKELFEQIKYKYQLIENKKNESGFYRINDKCELVVNEKEDFKMEIGEIYNLEDLEVMLKFKVNRNKEKDKKDIENIEKYLNQIKK